PWYKQRNKFQLEPYLATEEGIAAINTNINRETPYIWLYALYYYAVIQASKLSFAELYTTLRHYIDDNDRCWKICLRLKSSVRDTSLPLSFSKDQVYLSGIIHLKEWLEKNDYDMRKLYMGKIDILDWPKVRHFYKEDNLLLPQFMEDMKEYKKKIKRV